MRSSVICESAESRWPSGNATRNVPAASVSRVTGTPSKVTSRLPARHDVVRRLFLGRGPSAPSSTTWLSANTPPANTSIFVRK